MQGNASLNVAWLLPKRDDRVSKFFCLMFKAEGLNIIHPFQVKDIQTLFNFKSKNRSPRVSGARRPMAEDVRMEAR